MIVYKLACAKGHEFETWFRDSAACDAQLAEAKVGCPLCGSTELSKALMAPRLGKGGKEPEPKEIAPARQVTNDPAVAKHAQMIEALRELRRRVEQQCDYVGPRFAEEARRIHYGEVDRRDIYGEASTDDAQRLKEEGIDFYGIPWLPRHDS